MSVITLQGKQGIYTFDPHNPSSLLGEGGMGAVFKGEQVSIIKDSIAEPYTRTVAIKILYRELTANPANIERAKIEASIKIHHKNLIKIYDFVEQNGIYHTVCEYLTGENLNEKISKLKAQGQVFNEKEAIGIILQVCDGLGELHKNGIVHRDIDPTNIRLLEDGGVKLFDFSIVKKTDSVSKTLTTTGGMIGKPHYASPEQILNLSSTDITPSSDIYALAITLYEMLTGKLPFEGASESAIVEKKTNGYLPKNALLSSGLYNILKKATHKNSNKRYSSIKDFIKDLNFKNNSLLIKKRKKIKDAFKIFSLIILMGIFLHWRFYYLNNNWFHDPKDGMIIYSKNGKIGFYDEMGKEVIPPKYEDAYPFSEGLAAVLLNSKWGYIDERGNIKIPFKYENEPLLYNFDYNTSSDFLKFFEKKALRSGNIFSEGLARVKLKGKWGYIDKLGNEAVPFIYDEAYAFSEGLAKVGINNKFGFIDKRGNIVIPLKYEWDVGEDYGGFYEGLAKVGLPNSGWGFINKADKEIVPLQYKYVNSFSNGFAAINVDGKWGYIDKTGKEVISPKYDDATFFSEGFAGVKLNDKWGYINENGEKVIDFKYDGASPFSEGLAAVELEKNWETTYIDKEGKEIVALREINDYFNYFNLKPFKGGKIFVQKGPNFYFIDKNGIVTNYVYKRNYFILF